METCYCPQFNKICYFLKVPYSKYFHLTFFIKNIEYLPRKLFQHVSSFPLLLILLRAPIVLNQMGCVWNFVFLKFFEYLKKCVRDSLKMPLFWLYYKNKEKDFPHNFLFSKSTKIFITWEYKYFINIADTLFCVGKISCHYHEIYAI